MFPPMKSRVIFLFFLVSQLSYAGVLFSNFDDTRATKEEVLRDMIAVMGPHGAATNVANHEKFVLWTNEAAVLPGEIEGTFKSTNLPSFTMVTEKNKVHLQKVIEEQTGHIIALEKIGGVLIANPFEAAIMYYRQGYLGKGPREEDGRVSPIIIIYHEFAHAKDALQSPAYFSEMAVSFNKRYKNDAEQSAVQQQNDLLITLRAQGINAGDFRQSYGQNDLVMVTGPYEVP